MTNLDRLKGTPHLIDGFNSFLASWLGVEPNLNPIDWVHADLELFNRLPKHVQDFCEVIQRWPESKIAFGSHKFELVFPPQLRKTRRFWDQDYEVLDNDHVSIAWLDQTEIWVSINSNEFGQLYTDGLQDDPTVKYPLSVPLDEFLVTVGFLELVYNGRDLNDEARLPHESFTVFTGCHYADQSTIVNYHPNGYLWLSFEGDDPLRIAQVTDAHWWTAMKPAPTTQLLHEFRSR